MVTSDARGLGPGARLAVLVNPVARRAGHVRWLDEAARVLRQRYQVDIVSPADPAVIASAARAAATSHEAIAVVGGDGTLNRVVNALDETVVPIGLLPLGTGNDFARAMGIPAGPVDAATRLLDGHVRSVDLLDVNHHLFCTAGLLGLPADAALSVDRWTRPGSWTRPVARLLGGATYRLAGLQHLVLRGGTTVALRLHSSGTDADGADSRTREDHAAGFTDSGRRLVTHGVFVANTRVLGGGLVLPLDADDADGRMEVALIPKMPRLRLWWAFVCFARGWPIPTGVLDIVRTTSIEIQSDEELPFTADGDLMCRDTTFAIRVRPGGLRVIC